MVKKRGQANTTGSAMFLVILITFLMLLYILFLPPDERNALLGIKKNVTSPRGEVSSENVLLKEKPGTLFRGSKQDEFVHPLNSFSVFTRSEDKVLKDIGALYVSKSKFSEKSKRAVFVLDDPENTENVFLSFNVKKHNGRFIILLNDYDIFDSEVRDFVQVKLDNVQRENFVEFRASDPGFAFWSTNYYEIENVKLYGTVRNIRNREAINTFYLGEEEVRLMKKATLSYFIDCTRTDSGILRININNALISSNVPDCGGFESIILDKENLKEGRNEVSFFTEQGSYFIDQATIKTELEEPLWPVYYFEINSSQWGNITNKTMEPVLTFDFVSDRESKIATLEINGYQRRMDTRESSYSRNIADVVKLGNNYIKIIPETTLHIVEMRIELK